MAQFIITHDTARELQARKDVIEREMASLQREHELIQKKLDAIPLFLAEANGSGQTSAQTNGSNQTPVPADGATNDATLPAPTEEVSLPATVRQVLRDRGRLSAIEIRGAVLKAGVPRDRLGATYSYLYTVLGRLAARGEIQKVRNKYQLPSGHQQEVADTNG